LLFVGCGVSGGEEGARHGPSIMPGGSDAAWPHLKPIFQAISAKVSGEPCCDWVGPNGSGHYVKMVHNGIEYGDCGLIAEAYDVMKRMLGMNNEEMAATFDAWNKTELDSYLIEITAKILKTKDTKPGAPSPFVVENILDAAGQKGTGKWTGKEALEIGIPVTLIAESVFARCLSSMRDERVRSSKILTGPTPKPLTLTPEARAAWLENLRQSLYAAKIVSYAQGFMLLRAAATEYKWTLNYGGIALMWRGGCIIRSVMLGRIRDACEKHHAEGNLLTNDFFLKEVSRCQDAWRRVVAECFLQGLPVPCTSTALAFYDGLRTERYNANMIQAQRDFFGAHTYQRLEDPNGPPHHTDWTGTTGRVTAGTYKA